MRLNILLQQKLPASGESAAGQVGAARRAALRSKYRKDMTLATVVERARARLVEARGGEVTLRPGILAAARKPIKPSVLTHPKDAVAAEGRIAEFKVKATGEEPLQYQWYKDDAKLTAATSDSATLIITDVTLVDQGQYHCVISNRDGTASSNKAALKVQRQTRLARATSLSSSSAALSLASSAPPPAADSGGTTLPQPRVSRLQKIANRQQRPPSPPQPPPAPAQPAEGPLPPVEQQQQPQQAPGVGPGTGTPLSEQPYPEEIGEPGMAPQQQPAQARAGAKEFVNPMFAGPTQEIDMSQPPPPDGADAFAPPQRRTGAFGSSATGATAVRSTSGRTAARQAMARPTEQVMDLDEDLD